MRLQKLKTGCVRCQTQRILQYIECQHYKPIQERQLMHYARVILSQCDIQGRQAQHVKQLVRRFAANQPPVYRTLLSTDKSHIRLFFPSNRGGFQRPVRFHQTKSEPADNEKKYDQFVEELKKKQEKSVFKDGISAPQAVAIVLIVYLLYSIFKTPGDEDKPKVANNWMLHTGIPAHINMLDFIFTSFITSEVMTYPSNWVETVAYNPSLLYSTLIVAILLTKGYGRHMAMAIGRKVLQEPSRKVWRTIRAIKPRQIVYYGLRWGIPLYQLKELLLLHRNLVKKRPFKGGQRCSQKDKKDKKLSFRRKSLNSTVSLYRKMPLKPMSRVWGKMTCWELPMALREPLLGLYVWMFGVQLHEAEDDNLKNYNSLNELFRRKLKPNVRIVDQAAPVTSPADGRILHFGKVEDGVVEQVKGVNYTVKGFLGPLPGDEERTKPIKDSEYQEKMKIKPGYDLYNCIIYLAPGDYHRFHSASDWKISHRRHFPGELLSVNPGVARWVQGLFNMNERAVYSGTWEHGYFSYTAVGATNVGSIKIYFDEDLETNTGASHPNHVYHDRPFGSPDSEENISLTKGEMIGEFNLGSTVVLLFEAPHGFEFNVKPGQKVQVGESLGAFLN